jgi:sialidase-1
MIGISMRVLAGLGGLAVACSHDDPAMSPSASTDGSASSGPGSGETTGASGADTTTVAGHDDLGGLPTRPSGWQWSFEEGVIGADASTVVGAIVDDGGDGLAGTASAGLRYVEGIRPGTTALAFPGDGAHVRLDDAVAVHAADLLEPDALRIELTFRTDLHGAMGPDGAGTLLARGPADGPGWWLGVLDGRIALRLDDGTDVIEGSSDARVDDGVWHRAVVSFDREAAELAVTLDGTEQTRVAAGAALGIIATDDPVLAGADGDGARGFAGELDELRFLRTPPPPITPGPRRATTTVLAADTVPRPGGGTYANVRIPAVVVTPAGTLLAFAEGRVHGECDVGDIDIVMSRSDDGGATWSAGETLLDPGTDRVWNPIPIVDATADRVVLMTTTQRLDPGCNPSPASCACDAVPDSSRVEVRASDDDGLSFGEPVDITDAVVDDAGSSLLIGPSHGIQLHGAEHSGSLLVPAMHRRSGDGKRGGHVLRSDDGGTSWAIIATETASPVNVNESSAAELDDGRVLVNTRHQLSAEDQTPAELAAGLRGEAIVEPGGSWASDPAYARVATFRGPVVHGTLLAWPGSERHGDARRLLFSLPAGEHGSNVGRRHDLRLWLSHDDGASWIDGVRLAGDWAAYSDVVAIDDDHIGVLFEAGADADGFYHRVDFLRAAVQPLDDATLASWSFEDGNAAEVADGGPFGLILKSTGPVELVEGRHASTAVRFAGDARLCLGEPGLRSALDFGARDSFAIEVWFRTTAHGSGGSAGSGVLIGKTRTGSEPAWWLRVEDGHVRFLAAACNASTVNCGVVAGQCDDLPACTNVGATSTSSVSDGEWHRVVVSRDAAASALRMSIDDEDPTETSWPTGDVVKNDEAVCLGAFADDARGFIGDLDLVRVRSRPSP